MSTFPRPKTGTGPSGIVEPDVRGVSRGAAHRRHLRDHRGAASAATRRRSDDWCNLGQGMPEAEALPGAPPRIAELPILAGDQEYAPVAGLWELREAIAGYYNDLFRRGMGSKYSRRERRGLRRRSLGADARRRVARQHQPRPLPAGLHGVRGAARASSVCSRRSRSCSSPSAATRSRARICAARCSAAGSSAILASNPANPTGKVIGGQRSRRSGSRSAASSTAR